ncbi:MAG: hypothetical protein IJX03_06200 [Clostridia bacterium]|nr:hypothetical protein [Clostridia bacterium]
MTYAIAPVGLPSKIFFNFERTMTYAAAPVGLPSKKATTRVAFLLGAP